MTNTPSGVKSIAKVPNQKATRRPKSFSFYFFFFRQASSKLCHSFMMVFAQNGSILPWVVHQSIVFLTSLKSHEALLSQSLKNYGFICNAIFFTCTHVRNHLATKCSYYTRLLC